MKGLPGLSLLLSALSLGWGIWNATRLRESEGRLDLMRRNHYRTATQNRERFEALEEQLRTLRVAARSSDGARHFAPQMTVEEALTIDPRVGTVLAGFHIGGCDGCAVEPSTTIEGAAQASGQDSATILSALDALVSHDEAEVSQLLERRPNVDLNL